MAVIDASIMYGASRWYLSLHSDPTWAYAAQYRAAEDRLLFLEFLHDLILYDRIVLDCSSLERIGDEILDLKELVNTTLGATLIKFDQIAPDYAPRKVINCVCRLLHKISEDSDSKQLLLSTSVPWYYRDKSHHDRSSFERYGHEWDLDPALIPVAIFMYRGICYSGYSHHLTKIEGVPSAYLASPGRLKALAPIFDKDAFRLFSYPREAYYDLVELLDLPPSGYSFSHLPFPEISKLADTVFEAGPKEALSLVLKLRQSKEAIAIRDKWSERIWKASETCCVGASMGNVVSGATVIGDVYQTVTIASAN
jgi:hypothetical protein